MVEKSVFDFNRQILWHVKLFFLLFYNSYSAKLTLERLSFKKGVFHRSFELQIKKWGPGSYSEQGKNKMIL